MPDSKTKKMVNRFIGLLLILLIPAISFGQKIEYKSKEQDLYYSNNKYKPFEPVRKKEILKFKKNFFECQNLDNYTSNVDSLYYTPYQDSVNAIMNNPKNRNPMIFPESIYIGKIEKSQILKYEKKGQIEAFIYTSNEFERKLSGELGIWVAYSANNGKQWEYLYTGIVQRQPLYLKWYSSLPLIVSENKLQIESSLLRQLAPLLNNVPKLTYEVIKDGLNLVIDLNVLRRDTDGDGLTDIVENKLFTNINNKDTDGDGIFDNLDLNPRLSVSRTDKTEVFERALNNESDLLDTTGLKKSSKESMKKSYATPTTETIIIVSDNPDIQSIQPKLIRVIIISTKEYKKQKSIFQNELNEMFMSPLFKVDDEKDTYIFSWSLNSGGGEYLAKKTKYGWDLMTVSSWIY